MKEKIRSVFVELLTSTLGNLLVVLRPNKVRQLSEKGLTLVLGDHLSSTERLMRRAILKKIEKTEDHDKLSELHKTYWVKQGDDFVNNTQNNLENIHLPAYKTILDVLRNEVSKDSITFGKLVEIGTGNGSVLSYLSSSYSDVEELIGIDLSKEQTKTNNSTYKGNPKLEFVAGDVLDWIEQQKQGNFIFFTFRGVLEYFSQQQLSRFFEKLNSLGHVIFYAIEPTDAEHNYETHSNSKVYGVEGSFSHNYAKLFKDAGFKIWHQEQKKEQGHTNIISVIGAKNF